MDPLTTFVPFASWEAVQAHIRAGLAVYYQAPLDFRHSLIDARLFKNGKIRVRPPTNAADPFTADRGHFDRFRRRL